VPRSNELDFDTLWDRHASELARMAAAFFNPPHLDPAPDLRAMLEQARASAAAEWPAAAPKNAAGWLRRKVGGELLGCGHQLYQRALHRLLQGQVWSKELVEELVQGAATRATERLDELIDRPRPLFGWLCQLVRQQRIDWLRARSAQKRDAGRTVSLEWAPKLADTGTTPTQAERRTRVREMFDRVLADLPADDGAVLRLHADEHLGPSEIAVRLGIQAGDARIRLYRARRRALQVWVQLFPSSAADLADLGLVEAEPREIDE
jgi:RNA polymerase sigma factor (sigma-70 family)